MEGKLEGKGVLRFFLDVAWGLFILFLLLVRKEEKGVRIEGGFRLLGDTLSSSLRVSLSKSQSPPDGSRLIDSDGSIAKYGDYKFVREISYGIS